MQSLHPQRQRTEQRATREDSSFDEYEFVRVPPITLTDEDVQRFRAALERDTGKPIDKTDEQIRKMALDTVYAFTLVAKIWNDPRFEAFRDNQARK